MFISSIMGCCNEYKNPVALLRSLSDEYPWERYETSYPPSIGFICMMALALNYPRRLICQKTKKPNQYKNVDYIDRTAGICLVKILIHLRPLKNETFAILTSWCFGLLGSSWLPDYSVCS